MIRVLCLNPVIDRMYYINNFVPGSQYHGNVPDVYPSGKGMNIVRVLYCLGEKSALYAFIGGPTGQMIADEAVRNGAEFHPFRHEGNTRTTVNIIDRETGKETEITEKGEKITQEQQDVFFRTLKTDLKKGDIVICSGLPMNGMDTNVYKRVSEICVDCGCHCVVDANGEYLKGSFPGHYLFAKPNRKELAQLFGEKGDIFDMKRIFTNARKVRKLGVVHVLVSLGSEGGVYVGPSGKKCRIAIPRCNVVSTIGSGDSVVAGFCFGLNHHMDIASCISLSMACGISNAMQRRVGFIDCRDVEKLRKEITIEEENDAEDECS